MSSLSTSAAVRTSSENIPSLPIESLPYSDSTSAASDAAIFLSSSTSPIARADELSVFEAAVFIGTAIRHITSDTMIDMIFPDFIIKPYFHIYLTIYLYAVEKYYITSVLKNKAFSVCFCHIRRIFVTNDKKQQFPTSKWQKTEHPHRQILRKNQDIRLKFAFGFLIRIIGNRCFLDQHIGLSHCPDIL